MPPRRIPKYRCYKPKNLALVVIDGRQHYLGRYGSLESWEKYHRLVAEHIASRNTLQVGGVGGKTCSSIEALQRFCERLTDVGATGTAELTRTRTQASRRRAAERAARECDRVGL
jgi:hypothetical protein